MIRGGGHGVHVDHGFVHVDLDPFLDRNIHQNVYNGAFPFGLGVYKNDLDDYYFYGNNLPVKIYRALLDENAEMLKGPGPK